MKTNKSFDCVEMQHRGGSKVQTELAGMTRKEQLEYWRERTVELLDRQKKARKAKAS